MTTRTVLVIGATGILAPAAGVLRERGDEVIGMSRHGADGTIAVDAQRCNELAATLADKRWDDALVYGRAVTDSSLGYLRAATPGRCVLVRTSAAADPAHGILIVPRDTVQLGWTAGSEHRWHTPEEVSEAALTALDDGDPRTLGTVRPWSDRP
ncbi:hypothetical protein ASD56_02045 [Microbacterium sp. Root166]|uniref:hypothetical protein n=1 Tax=Microbacterium sp. Root166 TaxID=1736478 RepID=UPI0006F3F67E|nr:hypothetical protein [Microbacterium sp. Root166]KQZ85171.1 hypothetical protein ASD56_02045 [Microbacterium sp. Root166]